jgi:hypothetical protein
MAEFPLAAHSEAVSKVLSSVLPPRTYAYLSAFLPGFFFEISICLANPRLVQELIARSNQAANLGRYPKILIAAFIAFVLGNAFMLWVGVVHRILEIIFRISRFLWGRFCAWPLLPLLNRLVQRLSASQGKQPWWKGWWNRWWNRRVPWIQDKIVRPVHAAAYNFDFTSAGVRKLWAILTRNLFKEHYGIALADLEQEEWDALYLASSSVPMTKFSDHLLMVVSQALGWSGLAATRLAPSLINRNYILFNLFLIAIGVFYQWRVIRGLHDEYLLGLLRVRALLREIRKGKKQAEPADD